MRRGSRRTVLEYVAAACLDGDRPLLEIITGMCR